MTAVIIAGLALGAILTGYVLPGVFALVLAGAIAAAQGRGTR